jgi:hypothetical protein
MSCAEDGSHSSNDSRALTTYLPPELRPSDHAYSIAKVVLTAALSGVAGPVSAAIGAIGSLICEYAPSASQKADQRAHELLFYEIGKLGSRIKSDAINKEEFADLYKRFCAVTAKTNREEKLRAAARIVASSLLPPGDPAKSTYEELDHLMHCVDALSIGAMASLAYAIQAKAPRLASRGDVVLRFPELRQRDQDPDLAYGLVSELDNLNLLHITEGAIGAREYENHQFRVTRMGVRFYERFLKPDA